MLRLFKMLIFVLLTSICTPLSAEALMPEPVYPIGSYPRLNEISFVVSAEQWVSTNTAKVIVSIDANLDQKGLDNLQVDTLALFKKLAKEGAWRITQFSRTQNESELENVHIEAEARLEQSQLADIRTTAKSLSKPGMKYSIVDIQYSPMLSDIESVNNQLRNQLYQKIKAEIDAINRLFNSQFYVHKVNFQSGEMITPMPSYKAMSTLAAENNGIVSASGGTRLGVSQKITLTATVTVAASILVDK